MPQSVVLDTVRRGRLCTGCGACAAIVPEVRMLRSRTGFHRPVTDVPLDAGQDNDIAAICPGLRLETKRTGEDDALWGRILSLQVGYASDADIRFRASSGGALSALLVHLLESNAVDFVLQTSAAPDDPIANRTVCTTDAQQVILAAGSRYAPSSPLAGIERHLASGKRFAFVGKPCDVAALRAMSRHDPRVRANVRCMISFFCAGVPSRLGAQEVLKRLGVQPGFLKAFRYRGHGWPGSVVATLKDGSIRQMSYRDSWGGVLSRHVQFRCKICPDGTGNEADIVCADAWHGDTDGYPSFEEADGQSLTLARTENGDAILRDAIAAGAIQSKSCSVAEIEKMQPGQVSRMRALVARLAALWITMQPRPVFKGFRLFHLSRGAGVLVQIRNFLGTGKRVVLGRR